FLSSWRDSAFIDDQARALGAEFEVRFFDCAHSFSIIPKGIQIRLQARRIIRDCRQQAWVPDLIHAHVAYPAGVIGQLVKKEFGVPLVLTEHTGPLELLEPYFGSETAFNAHFLNYDQIICVSRFLKNQLSKRVPTHDQISVLGNIVGKKCFDTEIKTEIAQQSALYVGRLTEEKGIIELSEALKLVDGCLKFKFIVKVIGNGPLRSLLESTALELKNIKLEFLPEGPSVVCETLNEVRFLLLPSRIETFSMVAAEALAMGRPVLGFDCGGPSDFVSEKMGHLIRERDPKLFANKMLEMINMREWELTSDECQNRRHSIERRFSAEAIFKGLEQVYLRTLRVGRPQVY
ncbi:MAG TPA: glycosyltransferase, partial [Oligoflexia bacterium]|nr:glycosyltransferase [Oligoflexia bacterium]